VCGRFALFADPAELVAYFELEQDLESRAAPARYNVAPGQAVAAVRIDERGRRRLDGLRWGLVPFWAKDASIGHRMINARGETLAERPAFREALHRRRCLIPASGFYEWRKTPGRRSQPFFIAAARGPLLAFAGLWERWRDPQGERLESCTIVTTHASSVVAPIHARMPVIVSRADQLLWLDPTTHPNLAEIAARGPELTARPVSLAVNDPRHDGPELIEVTADVE
jgi:putative SOS response-associated peptidase YedK